MLERTDRCAEQHVWYQTLRQGPKGCRSCLLTGRRVGNSTCLVQVPTTHRTWKPGPFSQLSIWPAPVSINQFRFPKPANPHCERVVQEDPWRVCLKPWLDHPVSQHSEGTHFGWKCIQQTNLLAMCLVKQNARPHPARLQQF